MHKPIALALTAALLTGCTAGPAPRNVEGANWMPEQDDWREAAQTGACTALPDRLPAIELTARPLHAETMLGPGDRLRVKVIGDESMVSGVYVIESDGSIALPGIGRTLAAGRTVPAVQQDLAATLVSGGIVRPLRNAVRIDLVESAGVSVAVEGAVFNPGALRVGERAPDDRVGQREGEATGDTNVSRTLATALRAAGGVRPDADIARVGLIRGGTLSIHDLRPGHSGSAVADVELAAGDRIIVLSSGCFDAGLVRPSPVTTPGIRVFMSNLTRPANNNAGAAIGKETTSLPYGTRFLQALVAANCVGGSHMNAGRRAVLISRNPMNGRSVVIERDVEDLVRSDRRDGYDPYLMPGDALACYDSRWMNFRDALGLFTDAVSTVTPALLLDKAVD